MSTDPHSDYIMDVVHRQWAEERARGEAPPLGEVPDLSPEVVAALKLLGMGDVAQGRGYAG